MTALLNGITPGAPSAPFWATVAASGNGTVRVRWMTSCWEGEDAHIYAETDTNTHFPSKAKYSIRGSTVLHVI